MTDTEVDELLMRARKGGAAPALIAKAQALVKRDRQLVFHRCEERLYLVGREPNVFLFQCRWDLPVHLMHQAVANPHRNIDASALAGEATHPALRSERVRQRLEHYLVKLERSSGELAMALRGRLIRRSDRESGWVLLSYVPDHRSPTIKTTSAEFERGNVQSA